MAFSKINNLLLPGLAFAVVLLISSEISAARELQSPETTQTIIADHEHTTLYVCFPLQKRLPITSVITMVHGFHHGHGHGHRHGHGHHDGHGHGHRHRHHGGHGHKHHRGHHRYGAAETQEVENEAGEN
ncbi:hypothetical protein Q3G72_010754 [Acer saccharum]|nr:hypothetical protein Q3G72_010754 [Acer saccharum]